MVGRGGIRVLGVYLGSVARVVGGVEKVRPIVASRQAVKRDHSRIHIWEFVVCHEETDRLGLEQ